MTTCLTLTIIPVCIPNSNEDYIKVGFPIKISEKDDFGHYVRIDIAIKEAIQKQKSIYGWNGKLEYKQGVCVLAGSLSKEEQEADIYNEKLKNKLMQMTKWDFYNKKY